jgi:kumamolisin
VAAVLPDRFSPAQLGRYLGPAREKSITFTVLLTSGARPSCLQVWASRRSLAVNWAPGQDWAMIVGAPAAVGRAFGVTIGDYGGTGGKTAFSADRPAEVPAGTCHEVAGVGTIHSAEMPTGDDVPGGALLRPALLKAYDALPLVQRGDLGRGETVVLVETDGYKMSDLLRSARDEQVAGSGYNVSNLGPDLPAGYEATMDMETVHQIAPQAHIVYLNLLAAAPSNASISASFINAIREAGRYPGAVVSISLGVCEHDALSWDASDLVAMEKAVMAAEQGKGLTVFASSGDSGGLECTPTWPTDKAGTPPQPSYEGVQAPAVLPAVTGVGGTYLSTSASGGYAGEAAWDEPLLSQGSGGGVSHLFARPSWQTGLGTGGLADYRNGRQVPDVSADADANTGALVVFKGQPSLGGGTSLATPIWAAFTVLLDQYLGRHIGFFNPLLYRMAASAPYPAFHDVTVGGNDFYAAGPGYDMVTGLGTPDVWDMARDLTSLGK